MDNTYVFSLIIYGVLFFGIIVGSYLWLIRKCVKEKKDKELVLISCFFIEIIEGKIYSRFIRSKIIKNFILFVDKKYNIVK